LSYVQLITVFPVFPIVLSISHTQDIPTGQQSKPHHACRDRYKQDDGD